MRRDAPGRIELPEHVVPKYAMGEYVVIIKDPYVPALKGLAGKVIDFFGFDKRIFYQVEAENYGPQMAKVQSSGKRVRAWMKGNTRSVPASALMRVSEAPDGAVFREVTKKK